MECEAEKAAQYLFGSLESAMQWLADHPDVAIGTAVVVAGTVMIVATGPAGALILVAA